MKKQIKSSKWLHKSYAKRLKILHKKLLKDPTVLASYFTTYLNFLRDVRLLELPSNKELSDDLTLASLVTAISEYELYNTCIKNYYTVVDGVAKHMPELSEAEANAKYQHELEHHNEAFWGLVKLCLTEWESNVKF